MKERDYKKDVQEAGEPLLRMPGDPRLALLAQISFPYTAALPEALSGDRYPPETGLPCAALPHPPQKLCHGCLFCRKDKITIVLQSI